MRHSCKTSWLIKIATVLCAPAVLLSSAFAVEKLAPADNKQGPDIFVQLGHSSNVSAMAISPDGKHAVSGSSDPTIKLWNIPLKEIPGTSF